MRDARRPRHECARDLIRCKLVIKHDEALAKPRGTRSMNQLSRGYQPVVIIGAGRSGTKILKASLCRLPGAGSWPCDEINYVWRHGNASESHDELQPERARPRVRRYIRRCFDRLARRRGLAHVVEKTCANSLRVAFVDRVVPDALFVFLVRDGRDVVASARKRWKAPLDLPYLLAKARFVPLTDVPYYGPGAGGTPR